MSPRILTALIAALVIAAVVAVFTLGGDDEERYLLRGVFDTASFVVPDEDVRIGGANVGHVEAIDVSREQEVVSVDAGPKVIPGKAIIVMEITDPGFKDFREDASCIIRPQSLIGEKYIDCRPTEPRRSNEQAPPPLEPIPADQPGAGEYLLPLENNGKIVDVDLVNNIMREPYAERFRIILNELGGAFAARGQDLDEIVERANPALREVDELFEILVNQRHQLAQLTVESDQILRPLARERQRLVSFMRNSGESAEAAAEYSNEIRQSFQKFPTFLREFRQTMGELGGFAEEAAPVARDLNRAAPSFTVATQALTPFSRASTTAITSLGAAGEVAGPLFAEAEPVVATAATLAESGVQPMHDLSAFLSTTQRTGGFEGLMDVIYRLTGVMNGYDSYGHYARTLVVPTNCLNYEIAPTTGCGANFRDLGFSSQLPYNQMMDMLYALAERGYASMERDDQTGGISPDAARSGGAGDGFDGSDDPDSDSTDSDDSDSGSDSDSDSDDSGSDGDTGDGTDGDLDAGGSGGASSSASASSSVGVNGGGSADLLEYLLAP